jgi:cell division protein FtsB
VLSKIITVMLIVIGVVLAFRLAGMNDQIAAAKKTQSVLYEQLSSLQSSNAALGAMIESADDPKIKENIARSRLGLTLPGEIVYKEY